MYNVESVSLGITKQSISKLSIYILVLIMLYSMHPWFFWNHAFVILVVLMILFVLLRLPFVSYGISKKQLICYCVCFVMCCFIDIVKLVQMEQFSQFPGYLLRHFVLLYFVIILNLSEKKRLVHCFTNVYSFILLISMLFYFLYLSGVNLPYFVINYELNSGYPSFNNYIFLITVNGVVDYPRFQSIFLEPGHIGMISSLLLYVNNYDFKNKSTWIMILSILLSLSLAAYVLLIIGVVIYFIFSKKRFLKNALAVSVIMTGLIISSLIYYKYNQDSVYSKLILSRLELDDNRGIVGNNRTDSYFDYYYSELFFDNTYDVLFGIDGNEFKDKFQWGNTSYKTFIVNSGLVGLFLLFVFYLSIVNVIPSRRYIGLLLLYIASFLQRPYALWEVELYLFMGAGFMFVDSEFKLKNNYVIDL